jgi:hypothetical protein
MDISNLLAEIKAVIKTNGVQEITGQKLQNVLVDLANAIASAAEAPSKALTITQSSGASHVFDGSKPVTVDIKTSTPNIYKRMVRNTNLNSGMTTMLYRGTTLSDLTVLEAFITFKVLKGLANPTPIDLYISCDGEILGRATCTMLNVLDSTGNTPPVSCNLKAHISGVGKEWMLYAYTNAGGATTDSSESDPSSFVYVTEY